MDATTKSVPQGTSTGRSSDAQTEALPQAADEQIALRQAHALLEQLFNSREFKLYIDPESSFGRRVHQWLTSYAQLALGRGFGDPSSLGAEIGELETATDELVGRLLECGDSGTVCTVCQRGTVGGVLGHADSCAAGRLYAAIAAVREQVALDA